MAAVTNKRFKDENPNNDVQRQASLAGKAVEAIPSVDGQDIDRVARTIANVVFVPPMPNPRGVLNACLEKSMAFQDASKLTLCMDKELARQNLLSDRMEGITVMVGRIFGGQKASETELAKGIKLVLTSHQYPDVLDPAVVYKAASNCSSPAAMVEAEIREKREAMEQARFNSSLPKTL